MKRDMEKNVTDTYIATTMKNGLVEIIGKGVVFQPEVKFNHVGIKWFDDSSLVKNRKK